MYHLGKTVEISRQSPLCIRAHKDSITFRYVQERLFTGNRLARKFSLSLKTQLVPFALLDTFRLGLFRNCDRDSVLLATDEIYSCWTGVIIG